MVQYRYARHTAIHTQTALCYCNNVTLKYSSENKYHMNIQINKNSMVYGDVVAIPSTHTHTHTQNGPVKRLSDGTLTVLSLIYIQLHSQHDAVNAVDIGHTDIHTSPTKSTIFTARHSFHQLRKNRTQIATATEITSARNPGSDISILKKYIIMNSPFILRVKC